MKSIDKFNELIQTMSEDELKEIQDVIEFKVIFGSNPNMREALANKTNVHQVCPYCSHNAFIKHGVYGGDKQRYQCKSCKKTFNDFTGTILADSKLSIPTWIKYIECMLKSYTLSKCSIECNISLKGAFQLRHKILNEINDSFDDTLSGVVQADETFLSVSYKGNHSKSEFNMPRKSRKRGGQVKYRGLSHEKVCIGTAVDSESNIIIKPLCLSRVQINPLADFFKDSIVPLSYLLTDRASAYMQVAQILDLKHIRLRDHSEYRKDCHINTVNSIHNNFKAWLVPFRGVSTKYLNNYTAWFKLIQDLKHKTKISQIYKVTKDVISTAGKTLNKDIAKRVSPV